MIELDAGLFERGDDLLTVAGLPPRPLPALSAA
jgi:hypothetical protein